MGLLLLSLGCSRNTCLVGLLRYVHFHRVKVLTQSGRAFPINSGHVWKIQFHPLGEFKEGPKVEREPGWTKYPLQTQISYIVLLRILAKGWVWTDPNIWKISHPFSDGPVCLLICTPSSCTFYTILCQLYFLVYTASQLEDREIGWIKKKYRIEHQVLACQMTFGTPRSLSNSVCSSIKWCKITPPWPTEQVGLCPEHMDLQCKNIL